MIIKKLFFYLIAFSTGFFLTYLGVPAGWLVGALVVGVIYSLFIERLTFSSAYFKFILGFIGVNIGLLMSEDLLLILSKYFLPLTMSIILILLGSLIFSKILSHYTFIDKNTAIFCCMPGGASVMMALSEEYGADQRIVSAFHTTRIILFVLLIPFLAGLFVDGSKLIAESNIFEGLNFEYLFLVKLCALIGIVLLSLVLAKLLPIPAAPFILSMILGFLFNQFIWEINSMPSFVLSFGQVLLGGVIGLRFNKSVLYKLKDIGLVSLLIMCLYVCLGLTTSVLIYMTTSLDFVTSMLSTVPAGAAEMASTAALLSLPSSIVASFQLIRLLILCIAIPLFAPLIFKHKGEA
ncbi:AbrB family transcriptional regulator [Tenuibacillus multivorans]|uniref:Membrane protein AbrB duplication n=1 Tax=Tenuibacillus multivorans TaxID=237069 RepID=A0A1H0BY80_9BACI|nr:AbrB family transcriptional regulator [Tenuibacillus multivorans]GEL78567.1 membrane protein [Tenuibacillus multivorans]SDN50552.1 hypothetical protein SAMN05216498_2434 [Tenuibacillus multivorans]